MEDPVSAEERYRRHGHDPALILVENRPQLALYLERALFAQGFEVALLSSEEIPADRLRETLALLQSIGLVVIYSAGAVSSGEKLALSGLAANRTFDLATMDLPADDQAAVHRALGASVARMQIRPADPSEVN